MSGGKTRSPRATALTAWTTESQPVENLSRYPVAPASKHRWTAAGSVLDESTSRGMSGWNWCASRSTEISSWPLWSISTIATAGWSRSSPERNCDGSPY